MIYHDNGDCEKHDYQDDLPGQLVEEQGKPQKLPQQQGLGRCVLVPEYFKRQLIIITFLIISIWWRSGTDVPEYCDNDQKE